MLQTSKTTIFLSSTCIIILMMVAYWYQKPSEIENVFVPVTNMSTTSKATEETAIKIDSQLALNLSKPNKPTQAQKVTENSPLNLHPDQQEIDYQYMSLADLKAAATSGDRHYQFALAKKLSQDILSLGDANNWYRKAAVLGSFNALLGLQSNRLRQASYVGALDSKASKKYLIEALAWVQVTKRRGLEQKVAIDSTQNNFDYLQLLNEQERSKAQQMGDFYYKRLVNERMKQGLGSFEILRPQS